MNRIIDARAQYDAIVIPAELSLRINACIAQAEKHHQETSDTKKPFLAKRIISCTSAAAAAFVLFTAALNTNTAFAQNMQELPVIGAIARVLTFHSFETEEDGLKLSVTIPTLEIISEDTNHLSDSINREILSRCEEYADFARQLAADYKQAFFKTGGTKEDWEKHELAATVSYEILSQTGNYLSFSIEGTTNWSSAYHEKKYYNIDLNSQTPVTLKALLGEDYIRLANESILSQIKERTRTGNGIFFSSEEGGFTSISNETPFYINDRENPVIVFDKYTIAPGSEGIIEFEIER